MGQEQINSFINQYVSMWHESDSVRRREAVDALFAEDAQNYTRTFAARGRDEIIARVARAYKEWVTSRGFVFRPSGNTDAHHHVIKFLLGDVAKGRRPDRDPEAGHLRAVRRRAHPRALSVQRGDCVAPQWLELPQELFRGYLHGHSSGCTKCALFVAHRTAIEERSRRAVA